MKEFEATHLIIKKKEAAKLTAAFVFVLGISFSIGYFKGKRFVLESRQDEIFNDALGDKISYNAAMSMHEKSANTLEEMEDQKDVFHVQSLNQEDTIEKIEEAVDSSKLEPKAYAQIVGFGNKRNALKFYNRLKNKDYPVVLKERPTGKNNQFWYQIVSEVDSKSKIEELINNLKKEKVEPIIVQLKD